MKLVLKILTYILLLFLLTAEKCGNNMPNEQNIDRPHLEIYHELESSLVSEGLNDESLEALGKRSVQKFYELVDYLNVCANEELDVQFRKQARKLIAEAFVSEEEVMVFFGKLDLIEDSDNYLLFNSNGKPSRFAVKLVRLENPFEPEALNYGAKISYHFQNSELSVKVSARKTRKTFGQEVLVVWDLFFEN